MRHLLIVAACLILAACNGSDAGRAGSATPLTVMTFNIRYGTAPDGVNHWDQRKDLCAARIVAAVPDLLGLQEALEFQNAFLVERLKDYTAIGVAREDGRQKGEHTTILFRTARFTPVASGTFWLSETPDVAGSKSWDSSLPRIATWARLKDAMRGGQELLWVNTHFDHKGKQARTEAARQIRRFLAAQGKGLPLVVTGDFNAAPGSEPYRALVDAHDDGIVLADAYAVAHRAAPEANDGTAHAYQDAPVTPRIDWILTSPHFTVRTATIDRHREGPLFPSDHFAVWAAFSY